VGISLRILIADDHETVRKGVCSILASRKDLEVCGEAANGKEAVEKACELKPDLVIMDITMPVLDGFAAAKRIRKLLPDIPILFLSMHDAQQWIEEAKAIGVQGFVSKNDIAGVLLTAVDIVLQKQSFFPA
jgi:DNA-binding NarL/FixJ family response regulator